MTNDFHTTVKIRDMRCAVENKTMKIVYSFPSLWIFIVLQCNTRDDSVKRGISYETVPFLHCLPHTHGVAYQLISTLT